MVGRSGDWDNHGEKGNVPIAIDGLLCMDCGTSWSNIDIAKVGWLSEVNGHSVMVVKQDKIVWMKDLAVSSEADTGQ